MPAGKPAGVACVNLDPVTLLCRLWGGVDYPAVCRDFRATADGCGRDRDEALRLLTCLERDSRP
jgi:hypothetical protein